MCDVGRGNLAISYLLAYNFMFSVYILLDDSPYVFGRCDTVVQNIDETLPTLQQKGHFGGLCPTWWLVESCERKIKRKTERFMNGNGNWEAVVYAPGEWSAVMRTSIERTMEPYHDSDASNNNVAA